MPSFDVVSQVDQQELENACNQARKEIRTRYDLKQTKSEINAEEKGKELLVVSDNDFTLQQVVDVLTGKMARRGISLKNLRFGRVDPGSFGRVKRRIKIQQGIPQETAKKIIKQVKGTKMKIHAAIQGDKVRISGKKKDDLQEAMTLLKKTDFGLDLQFTNFLD